MSDEEIYKEIQKYFDIQEFVNKATYTKYGINAWQFLCPRLLHTLLIIRKGLGKPITINNWHQGGKFSQRGLRTNIGQIVKGKTLKGMMYLSAHVMGKAVDFDVKGYKAEDVRDWISLNAEKLPYKVRLEQNMKGKPTTWCHMDVFYNKNNPKVYRFNV